jgi:hypothetical protein
MERKDFRLKRNFSSKIQKNSLCRLTKNERCQIMAVRGRQLMKYQIGNVLLVLIVFTP